MDFSINLNLIGAIFKKVTSDHRYGLKDSEQNGEKTVYLTMVVLHYSLGKRMKQGIYLML